MHSLQLWFMPSWLTHLFFRLIMTGLEAEIISPLPILCRYVYRRLLKAWAYLTGISESFLDHTNLIAIHTKWVIIWSKDLVLSRRLRSGRSKKIFLCFLYHYYYIIIVPQAVSVVYIYPILSTVKSFCDTSSICYRSRKPQTWARDRW